MELSERDKQLVIGCIERGEPVPSRFRLSLFGDVRVTELVWPGKTTETERTALPFQSIEQVDEPRSEAVEELDLFSMNSLNGRQAGGWTNKLIWGDNKLILSSLANGPLRAEIEAAGGLKLVYICWRSLKVAFCDHAIARSAIIEMRVDLSPESAIYRLAATPFGRFLATSRRSRVPGVHAFATTALLC